MNFQNQSVLQNTYLINKYYIFNLLFNLLNMTSTRYQIKKTFLQGFIFNLLFGTIFTDFVDFFSCIYTTYSRINALWYET